MYHSVGICQEIAERMKSPQIVSAGVKDSIVSGLFSEPQWFEGTFADGLPGIACFYASMDQIFPNEGWNVITHSYLDTIVKNLERDSYSGYSLFTGLCGACFTTYICSKENNRYQKLQAKLDLALTEEVEISFLKEAKSYLHKNDPLPPNLYNLAHGISGVLGYLLLRKENHHLHKLAVDCISLLIKLLNREQLVEGTPVPGWYVSPQHQLAPEETIKYPDGSFILGMPFGITGCLSALSLAAMEGIKVEGLIETITHIANWLKNQNSSINAGASWQHTIPLKNGNKTSDLDRDTWWGGIPAVARSLYLASKANKDLSLSKYAENAYLSMFAKPTEDWNMMGTSFMHGRAGVLATTLRMAQDTQNPLFWKQVDLLERDLIGFYKPESPFGFRMVAVDPPDHYRWVDHPGVLSGATGVGLALLLVQRRENLKWDRAFLIN